MFDISINSSTTDYSRSKAKEVQDKFHDSIESSIKSNNLTYKKEKMAKDLHTHTQMRIKLTNQQELTTPHHNC